MNSAGIGFYGLPEAGMAIRAKGRVVLVEGNLDVDRLRALGIQNAVAPTLALLRDDGDASALREFTETAVIFFDGDGAGAKAAEVVRVACAKVGIAATISLVPRGIRDPEKFVLASRKEDVERIFGT
jgi:DNA primase